MLSFENSLKCIAVNNFRRARKFRKDIRELISSTGINQKTGRSGADVPSLVLPRDGARSHDIDFDLLGDT
jgi:hypothetical protein